MEVENKNKQNTEKKALTPKFVKITAVICAAIIAAASIIGLLVPKNNKAVRNALLSLRENDTTYLEAKRKSGSERLRTETLTKELEDKQQELEELKKSQDSLDRITESNTSLESERDVLNEEIARKEKELTALETAEKEYMTKIMTWASGDYTVGSDIAPGRYTVTGTGSIAVASGGKSKVNKLLKSEGEEFTFADGDLIHIDGNAKIVP